VRRLRYLRELPPAREGREVSCLPSRLLKDIEPMYILAYTANDDWWVQLKHDGDRVQLHVTAGRVTLFSGRSEKVRRLPASIAQVNFPANDLVLDGELVGDTLWLFDVLRGSSPGTGIVDLRELPYEVRQAGLKVIVETINCPSLRLVETARTGAEKIALIMQAKADSAEGVVFIDRNAPYQAGRSGGLRWKFKASASLIVSRHHPEKKSIDVALFGGTRIGSVTMTGRDRPPVGSVVEVEYLYCHTSLVQPVFKCVRPDVRPAECTRAQLKFRDGIDPAAR
jgi:ATP-dependent DNA ligase